MATLDSLTAAVRGRLDALIATLRERCGARLVGVIAHGSAVRGGWRAGVSDVDLVCVLDDDPPELLAAIGPALELARHAARIEVMILTRAEIARSADCFPLLYGDLARTSVTLTGTNPFTGLTISEAHKRLRIEQELRELRIRLRRVMTDRAGEAGGAAGGAVSGAAGGAISGALDRKLKQARSALWALLALRGEQVGEGVDDVLRAAAAAYAVDLAPLARAREDALAAWAALARLLDAALADVDAREVAS